MNYTKKQLQSNERPLLRRLQRQVDKRKENLKSVQNRPANMQESKTLLSMRGTKSADFSNPFHDVDPDFAVLKDTKLGLYKRRGQR